MEVNKEQAERCRDIAAEALRGQNYEKAVKMFQKSLQLYPLPGVEALLAQSKAKLNGSSSSSGNSPSVSEKENRQSTSNTGGSAADTNTSSSNNTGSNGRAFTEQQAQIVNKILKAKSGGSKAHYRVLELEESCNEGQIKKAYRKLSLKVHPDKNPHPQADEAFKAVGLAYATLSDSQKRAIYDRYGEEDPDNRGGGGAGMNNPFGGMHMRPGQEVSPEDIFNMFFHGAGGPGVHFRTGFGPGVHFRADPMNFHNFQRRGRAPDRPRGQEEQPNPVAILFQFLPIILIMLLSFIKFGDNMQPTTNMPGHDRYFSLTQKSPFVNPLTTKLTSVKDIQYFVTNQFLRTYHRDRYQLAQVERMVEQSFESFLVDQCKKQKTYKDRLYKSAQQEKDSTEKAKKHKLAEEYVLGRCIELEELFPSRKTSR